MNDGKIFRKDLVEGDVFSYANWTRPLKFVVADDAGSPPSQDYIPSTGCSSERNQFTPVILYSGPTHDRLTKKETQTPGDEGDEKAMAARTHTAPADVTAQPHYATLSPEPIDVIEGWNLNFRLGNAIKYIARAGRKPLTNSQGNLQPGDGGEVRGQDVAGAARDIRKAISYLERELAALEGRRAWK